MKPNQLWSEKVLQVGPMPAPGQYIGGIAILLQHILENWDLPYTPLFYNTEGAARDFSRRANSIRPTWFGSFAMSWVSVRQVRRERPGLLHYHTSQRWALPEGLGGGVPGQVLLPLPCGGACALGLLRQPAVGALAVVAAAADQVSVALV